MKLEWISPSQLLYKCIVLGFIYSGETFYPVFISFSQNRLFLFVSKCSVECCCKSAPFEARRDYLPIPDQARKKFKFTCVISSDFSFFFKFVFCYSVIVLKRRSHLQEFFKEASQLQSEKLLNTKKM